MKSEIFGEIVGDRITLRSDNLSENSSDISWKLEIFHNFKSQTVFEGFWCDQKFDSTRKGQTNSFVMTRRLGFDVDQNAWFCYKLNSFAKNIWMKVCSTVLYTVFIKCLSKYMGLNSGVSRRRLRGPTLELNLRINLRETTPEFQRTHFQRHFQKTVYTTKVTSKILSFEFFEPDKKLKFLAYL